ncbi:MAG: orotate phosphoribosyltransferase [Parvularculaceae bacterium]
METSEVLAEFEAAGALLKGHFVLSSGRHSDTYLNKSLVATDPARVGRLCGALAAKVRERLGPDKAPAQIVAPALGAIVFGYEVARSLGAPFMFAERGDAGGFVIRRGFEITPGARVLVVEDIVSTGLSARECVAAVGQAGGDVVALACLIDRSGGTADVGAPMIPLATLDVATYAPDALPPELAATPAVKPGSRGRPS